MSAFLKVSKRIWCLGYWSFRRRFSCLSLFIHFWQHWKEDQSILDSFSDKSLIANNLLGKLGANLSNFFVFDGFGVATFIFPILLFFTGLYIILNIPVKQLFKSWFNGMLTMIWLSLGLAYIRPEYPLIRR